MSPNRKHSIIAVLRRAESLWIDRVRVPYSIPGPVGPLQGWQTGRFVYIWEQCSERRFKILFVTFFFHDMRWETTRFAKQSDLFSDVLAYSYHRPSGLKPPY